MDASTPFTEVEIPFKSFHIAFFFHSGFKDFIVVFPLGTTDDFSFARNKAIARGDGFSIRIDLHVEGFDVLGVVDEEQRSFNDFFGKEAFVLGLEVHAPFDVLVLELVAVFDRFLEDGNTLGVFHAGEGLGKHGF